MSSGCSPARLYKVEPRVSHYLPRPERSTLRTIIVEIRGCVSMLMLPSIPEEQPPADEQSQGDSTDDASDEGSSRRAARRRRRRRGRRAGATCRGCAKRRRATRRRIRAARRGRLCKFNLRPHWGRNVHSPQAERGRGARPRGHDLQRVVLELVLREHDEPLEVRVRARVVRDWVGRKDPRRLAVLGRRDCGHVVCRMIRSPCVCNVIWADPRARFVSSLHQCESWIGSLNATHTRTSKTRWRLRFGCSRCSRLASSPGRCS